MLLSLTLALMNRGTTGAGGSILEMPPTRRPASAGAARRRHRAAARAPPPHCPGPGPDRAAAPGPAVPH